MLPVIPGMFIAECYNRCIVCCVIMWLNECYEAFGLVLVLFTLQSKQQVINILLIVAWCFSGAGLHLNGLFIETVEESISLSGYRQYLH